MSNIHDLLVAIMTIARADTGPGGLVPLTGQAVPVRRFEDLSELDETTGALPLVTAFLVSSSLNRGAPVMHSVLVQFDAWVPLSGADGLESQMLDRVEAILSSANFAAQSLDVAATTEIRRTLSDLDFGRRRESMDMTMLVRG